MWSTAFDPGLTLIWKTLQQEGGQVMPLNLALIQVSAMYSVKCFSCMVCCCLSGITFRSIFKALLTRWKLMFLYNASQIQQAVICFCRGIAICTTSGDHGANGEVSFRSKKLPFSLQFKWTNYEILFWVAFIGRLLYGKERNACYLIGWFQCCLHLFVKIIYLILWNTTRKKITLIFCGTLISWYCSESHKSK